ncbi:hypothetical protein [Delftia tsuruhatensis]|uniref:hypothetical protein n=1 Tax=Delftia tsuruhatensis TaxID=180282 RepID=UPI0008F00D8A|nr:hypothetical protein [Delftia tsuruhatensis]SFB61774.1 hypothetical protein SAMN05444579_113144 [Delftia tsuruhatensis]
MDDEGRAVAQPAEAHAPLPVIDSSHPLSNHPANFQREVGEAAMLPKTCTKRITVVGDSCGGGGSVLPASDSSPDGVALLVQLLADELRTLRQEVQTMREAAAHGVVPMRVECYPG